MLDRNDNECKIIFVNCAKNNLISFYNSIAYNKKCTNQVMLLIERQLNSIIKIEKNAISKCYFFEKRRDFELLAKSNLKQNIRYNGESHTVDEMFNIILDKVIDKYNQSLMH